MKYMTVTDVKDRWGVSSDVVYDYIAAGRLKAVKFGRAWKGGFFIQKIRIFRIQKHISD